MQLTHILQLTLLAACQIAAAPVAEPEAQTPNAANDLVKRADVKPVSCGPSNDMRAWPLQSVQGAFDSLVRYGNGQAKDRPKAGTRAYPQQYGDNKGVPSDASVRDVLNAIPGCQTGQANTKYFEFPLTDPVFAGGPERSQGPDRVIAIAPNPGQGQPRQYTYCMAMTHRGGTSPIDPSFRPCTSV